MGNGLVVEAHNFEEVQAALNAAPKQVNSFVKRELVLFSRRVRKRLIAERMRGRPGINADLLARGKNVQAFVKGDDLASLKAVNKISRILRTHEEGITITPRQAGMLFLSRKSGTAGKGQIFARVKSVRIPARLGFKTIWEHEVANVRPKISDAMRRAVRVAMERHLQSFAGAARRASNF